jgi:hypothetical protein
MTMAAEETLTPDQQNELLFTQLFLMFQGAAYQHMGKVMNPVTNKIERDLAQAKHSIDMLGMLEAKTKGNLSENEKRLVDHVLYEIRMNYVDEVNKGDQEPEEVKPEDNDTPDETESGAGGDAGGGETPASEDDKGTEA